MATLRPILADHGYTNWVKGGLALKFAKEGIENFVERNIVHFHKDILNSLSTGNLCYSCSTKNIIQCRNNNTFCKFSKNICKVHDPIDPTKKSRPCPNYVCNIIRDEILNKHRFRGPSWKNTDSSLWCGDPWQLATCYMSDGYSAAISAADTDFTGLVSVIINNKIFDTEVTDNLNNKSNLFGKARSARNAILHKANISLTDAELCDYITTLDTMLADSKCLAGHQSAIQARTLLQQLLNGTLNVTERDQIEVLAEALRAIGDKTSESIAAVNKETDDARNVIRSDKNEALTAISKENDNIRNVLKSDKNEAFTAISKEKNDARNVIKSDKNEALTAISKENDNIRNVIKSDKNEAFTAISKEKDDARNVIKSDKNEALIAIIKEKDGARDDIKSNKDEASSTIDTHKTLTIAALKDALIEALRIIKEKEEEAVASLQTISTDSYDKIKKGLKAELLSVYQYNEHLTTPLSQFDPSEDKHIEQLYVTPNMKLVDHRRVQKDEGKLIETYKNIFQDEIKKIYVVGEAGMGKTALCQEMVSAWCHVQTGKIENMSDDQQAISKYDFLFYISLRDAITHSCVEEMIKHLLLPNKTSFHEPLAKVLKEERCLIVLDGLDEWTTANKTASSNINKGIPGRDSVRNCTVITTTRPWKLEAIQLKSSQIDAKVQLLGIDKASSEHLARNMITHLNDIYHTNTMYEDFVSEIEEKKIINLMTIPLVLKQVVCIWHSGKELGKNKSVIYCQMLEHLFELAKTRLEKDSQYQLEKHEWIKSSIKLPSCFYGNEICQMSKPLLFVLSKLAFQTLLIGDMESSLIFKSTKEGCYNMSPVEVNICIKIGILCQNKILKNCISPFKRISFLHKTFQEFLAAVFVSLDQSNTEHCVETIQQFCNTANKCREMSNVLTFISGICTSDITCTLLDQYLTKLDNRQHIIIDCMREGWTCSHDNKHFYSGRIDIVEPSRYLEQLCRVNIPNVLRLGIYSLPAAQCLQHILQIKTLNELWIGSCITPPISEGLLYDLIHNNRQTLTWIIINGITLRSNTRISTLISHVPKWQLLSISDTALPKQLLTSLQTLHSPPARHVVITNPTILPNTESTD